MLLVTTATERMRKNLEDNFHTPLAQQKASTEQAMVGKENPNVDKSTEATQALEQAQAVTQTARLKGLKGKALASFDDWQEAVIQRIGEAVNPGEEVEQKMPAAKSATSSVAEHSNDNTTQQKVPPLYSPIPTPLASSLPPDYPPMVINAILLLLLSLERYDARSRVLLLLLCSSLNVPASNLIEQESHTASALVKAALMSGDEESKKRSDEYKVSKWWKVGLASVAGAAVIGVTGGLAAPLVAAGIGGVMGGIGLGGTVAAGYLGAVASSGAIVGALFGAYGGKMTGEMMERYAAAVKDFAFMPVKDRKERLRVTVGISGWLTAPEEVVLPWTCLNDNADVYALRWVRLSCLVINITVLITSI